MKRYIPAIVTTAFLVIAMVATMLLGACKSQCGDHPCGGPKPNKTAASGA